MKVFAGTVDDAFWIDLGAAFDTANFRTLGSGVPGVLTVGGGRRPHELASDTVSGYAVNAIAIEVPIEMLTSTGPHRTRHLSGGDDRRLGHDVPRSRPGVPVGRLKGPFRQVQRMGNPLINELIIGIGSKDRFFDVRIPSGDSALRGLLPRSADREDRRSALRRRSDRAGWSARRTCCRW